MSMEPMPQSEPVNDREWIDVCSTEDVVPGTGAAAMIDGEQVAIVRTRDDAWYAIANFDPFSKAFVIARGIVGDRGGIAKIASPIYKQTFNLETGQCLEDESVRLPVYALRISNGRVRIRR